MIKTFRIGGIHPPEYKLSAGYKIVSLPPADKLIVPLSQHIGSPAVAVVKAGDRVNTGTLIGKSSGIISAHVHSPVSGTVLKIEEIMDSSGYERPAIIIEAEGDEWESAIKRDEKIERTCNYSPREIIEKIASAGIVGMGGAAFPTHVKLSPPPGMSASVLLVNGAECESYLTSDHALMLEKGEEILIGTEILLKAIRGEKAIICIENNKKNAIKHLSTLAVNFPNIKILPLKTKYPQGGEKQLIDSAIRRQVPSGALPIAVEALVQNVATVFAVYEAVQKNKPLIERVVTVSGKDLLDTCNVRVRIGTPLSELVKCVGEVSRDTGKIICGGPMMGRALSSLNVPVTKGSSGFVFISIEEALRKEVKPCIRCSKCVAACPMGLVPSYLMTVAEYEEWGRAEKFNITDCIECGSCNYVCPANRPLLDYIRIGKGKVSGIVRMRKS